MTPPAAEARPFWGDEDLRTCRCGMVVDHSEPGEVEHHEARCAWLEEQYAELLASRVVE